MIDFSPVFISLKTGIVTICITFVIGLLVAKWVFSMRNETAQMIIDGILTLPLVLPPTVAGFFLLVIFGNNGLIGKYVYTIFGVKIAFSWFATVIAAVVISFPLMYRSAKAALEQVDPDIIAAARTLGMSEWSIFIKVMIPSAMNGIVSGGILAFARGLGEFGATSMLAGNIPGKTRTLPLAVYSEVAAGDMHDAMIYVMIIVSICFAAVLVMDYYEIKTKRRRRR
jgi:molybdate transport system permease protein